MKKFLLIMFSPFAVVGGALVGYYSHTMRLAITPEAPFQYGMFLDYPYMWLGVVFLVLGMVVRAKVFNSLVKEVDTTKGVIKNHKTKAEKLEQELMLRGSQQDWILEAVREKQASMKKLPTEFVNPAQPGGGSS